MDTSKLLRISNELTALEKAASKGMEPKKSLSYSDVRDFQNPWLRADDVDTLFLEYGGGKDLDDFGIEGGYKGLMDKLEEGRPLDLTASQLRSLIMKTHSMADELQESIDWAKHDGYDSELTQERLSQSKAFLEILVAVRKHYK